ncbi:MAG TPA: hypothetical protein VFD43_09330, partial [Planctomycetota bacterium]|nr:hypothetical protein [Planctomycetota bacterium]
RTTRTRLEGHGLVQFEWGPEVLPADGPELGALLGELELETQPAARAAARQLVLRAGRLHALPGGPLALLGSRLLSLRGRLAALAEPFRARGEALDGSIADFVRHRLGEEALARIADPLVGAAFATAPERLSLRAACPELRALVTEHGSLFAGWQARRRRERAAAVGAAVDAAAGGEASGRGGAKRPAALTLRGGLGLLTDALSQSLGNRVLTNCRVAAVAQEPARFDDPWEAVTDLSRHPLVWRVDVAPHDGPGAGVGTWLARRLVLALPARAASRVLIGVDRTLGEALASISSESLVSISHAWRRKDVRHRLDAAGLLVPSSESQAHLGTLFS